jgi:hypothetical protein
MLVSREKLLPLQSSMQICFDIRMDVDVWYGAGKVKRSHVQDNGYDARRRAGG